ncbi:BspA family leucine-rich repeat surface protein [Lactococcus garvieae]|uniref:BspA family leucine-rich repeat surface protein n=1 Tax=Lactococcus garvieae TaxID=1363 RepID=UPI00398E77D0
MKKSRHRFKKVYLIFFISSFIFWNMSLGFNSIIFATTNDFADDFELKIQDENTSDTTINQLLKEDETKQNNMGKENIIVSGFCGTSRWWIDSEKVLHIGEGEFDDKIAGHPSGTYPWHIHKDKFNKIVFEGKVFAASNSMFLFSYLSEVEEIENLNYLDTSRVIKMSSMFYSSKKLQKLDVSHFNTSNVESMDYMFYGTSSLTSLDISSLDTSKATDLNGMLSATNFSELKLGPKVKFSGKERLPEIAANDMYTGKWVNVGNGTLDSPEATKKWTSAELLENYDGSKDADTYVWEKIKLEVQTKTPDILLGTSIFDIDPNDFIEGVKLGDVELSKNEYTVEIKNSPNTMLIGSRQFSLEVTPKHDIFLAQNITVDSNIIWGSTLVVKSDSLSAINASVSLLHKEGNPYLNANQASGFSGGTLTSRPEIYVYQNSEAEQILTAHYETVGNTPSTLAGKWNTIFQDNAVKYGNVLRIHVNKFNGGANWKGNNTFISRNNTLITETVGYDNAYYELTPSGYRLLHLNQLAINNDQKVKLNTSQEEMNKNISKYISLPEHIENPNDFRMEFESVDTSSSGNKKSTINVYETLESGGEFKTTYEVAYSVNPEVTESYYDIDGKQIEQSQTTEFNYEQEFTPNPEKYIENNGVLYIYKGWVDTLPGTGTIIPQEGVPEATKVEKNYYYIYDKADKFINVTLPTEVVFGTFENNNKISSRKYEIKNNSDELPIEVSLERFDKVMSDIKLLSSNTSDPTQEEGSAKLNLYVDNKSVIPGLTEDTPRQTITKIDTNASRAISLEGTYFGNMSDKNILDYKMHLKFKATQDNKN